MLFFSLIIYFAFDSEEIGINLPLMLRRLLKNFLTIYPCIMF